MRRYAGTGRFTAIVGLLWSIAGSTGCTNEPVSPNHWPGGYAPEPAPMPPLVVDTIPNRYAEFVRTTSVGGESFVNGYLLSGSGYFLLWKQVSESWTDGWEFATGPFTLTDTAVVLRLSLIDATNAVLPDVYKVRGVLRGDTLRLVYPDSMRLMNAMFSDGDYLLARKRDFP